MEFNPIPWKIIDLYFKDNPSALVKHHLQSYNDFFNKGLPQLIKEKNPIRFFKEQEEITTIDSKTDPITGQTVKAANKRLEYKFQSNLYIGGKDANRLYYGKPIIFDKDGREHFMYPNEARLRNMTYAVTIHYDVEVDFILYLEDKENEGSGIFKEVRETIVIPKVYLGKFPIMLQSDLCILRGLQPEVRFTMGECRNDPGGYFIVDGKEKVIICQEKFADNLLYIQAGENEEYSYSAKIRSVSEDASKPIRTLAVRMVAEQPSSTNGQIVVSIPNVRKPMPLFIVMRALGVISDKEIITYCLLDIDKYAESIDIFSPSVYDAGSVFTQESALKLIATFTKGKSVSHALDILSTYFLPHIGELNFKQKALYLGYIVRRMISVASGEEKPTNRDSYLYKRIEVSGMLIYQLFREYYTLQQKNIFLQMDTEHLYAKRKSATAYQGLEFTKLVTDNVPSIFANRIVEMGFRRAFKGDWGSEAHTKRPGVLQDLSRLSFWSFLSQLRKTNLHIAADGAKIVGPRLLNGTQWGILCPIHTPDGGNIGLHKHLSLTTHITSGCSAYPMIRYLRSLGIKILEECSLKYLSQTTKVLVNGAWIGATSEPQELWEVLLSRRRNGLFSAFTSIRWNKERSELIVLTDGGRACHPLFHVEGDKVSYQSDKIMDKITNNTLTWSESILGFAKKKKDITIDNCEIYDVEELYGEKFNLANNEAIIEYLDTSEMEGAKLAQYNQNPDSYAKNFITHIEIHPSVILSVLANQVIYPSNNQFPRDLFSCGQSKQAVSLYSSNYRNRMDKSALILHYGQTPLDKSRYLQYVTKEQHPYGVNAIVAVACYTGYNVEDAVIFNKASLNRGIFSTTYTNVYEATEESTTVGNITVDSTFMDVNNANVIGLKPGYDYSKLDPLSGLVRENTLVDDKTILIGMVTNSLVSGEVFIDASIAPKKGQIGYVDRAFLTTNESGRRLAKIRIRHFRTPAIGDKFCSRAGQKGTIGIVLEESDMPFTADGTRPDIIVNPHAFPSRMTIGHLVESLVSKAGVLYGGFGDCTAFINKGPKDRIFGNLLTKAGYSSTGNAIMYNGMTGEQLETEIYLGPTYYLRLKHMVKDKINYRARGPRTVLTRQTVQGRANNGGLRIGEQERDALLAHGMAGFLRESLMLRGDEFRMAICNQTGTIAIYNASRNLFLSPSADGPIKFAGNLESELNIVPVSRFGRDFSVIAVPYAFKLLYQELLAMNVQMRLITADNVEQLTSLVHGNNLQLLVNKTTFREVEADNKAALEQRNREIDDSEVTLPEPADAEIAPDVSPEATITPFAVRAPPEAVAEPDTSTPVKPPLSIVPIPFAAPSDFDYQPSSSGDFDYQPGPPSDSGYQFDDFNYAPSSQQSDSGSFQFNPSTPSPPQDSPQTPTYPPGALPFNEDNLNLSGGRKGAADKSEGDAESEQTADFTTPIVIRTPIVEDSGDDALPMMSTIEENAEELDDEAARDIKKIV